MAASAAKRQIATMMVLVTGCVYPAYALAEALSLDCTPTEVETTYADGRHSSQEPHDLIKWDISDSSVIENGIAASAMNLAVGQTSITWQNLVRPTEPGSLPDHATKITVQINRADGTFTKIKQDQGRQGIISTQRITGLCKKAAPGPTKF